MTHEDQSTRFDELLQLLSEHGFDGMAEAIQILMNEAMKLASELSPLVRCRISVASHGVAMRTASSRRRSTVASAV